ncbi:uncharacterized protein A4U43_C05F18560 [Asparagus officinalis]|uniref:Uncharacterized protein n=1 Tax=Asparagus officinalis TaxID=4686 RepID=A0A5P1EWZ7_ASPOF|nr:uncharacterized protein A4U43_C05F18560 [Asparagus officinalis]
MGGNGSSLARSLQNNLTIGIAAMHEAWSIVNKAKLENIYTPKLVDPCHLKVRIQKTLPHQSMYNCLSLLSSDCQIESVQTIYSLLYIYCTQILIFLCSVGLR